MGNALKRAERLKHETIGGETFVDATEVVNDVPTTLSVDPQVAKLEKVKAVNAQARAFLALFRNLSTHVTPNGYGGGREFSKAREKVEESVMWATKAIINQHERPEDEDERPAEKSQA